ncbi:hypothetical protein ABPG75_013539 [Micractinium tetrahymenae]
MSPSMPSFQGPCTWTGTGKGQQAVCTGIMEAYDLQSLLDGMLDSANGGSSTVAVTLLGVNMTGLQLAFLRAASFPTGTATDRTFQISIVDSVIAKNQFVIFGALAAQAGLSIDLQISNSQVFDNQLTVAAGIVSGAAGRASLNTANSEVRGNMVATAGGLALSATADAAAAGSGGNVASNAVAAAGLIATGGLASARTSLETVPAESNAFLGAGLPFTEEPLVSSIISTVMNAVFVDASSLSTGLANTQTQLCAFLSTGGSLTSFAYDLGLEPVRSVAWELLCDPASASHVQLSDIPGMLDGSAAPGALGTLRALHLLALGKGRLRVKSLGAALAFASSHPRALGDLLHALAVEEP